MGDGNLIPKREPPKHPLQLHGFEEKYRSCGLHWGKGGEPKSHRWCVNYIRNEEVVAPELGYEISASLHLDACCLCGHSHSSREWGQILQLQPGEGSPKLTLVSATLGTQGVTHDVPLSFRRKPSLCAALELTILKLTYLIFSND